MATVHVHYETPKGIRVMLPIHTESELEKRLKTARREIVVTLNGEIVGGVHVLISRGEGKGRAKYHWWYESGLFVA